MIEELAGFMMATMVAALTVLLPALVLTLLIEIPVGMLCGLRSRREIGAVALVNLITNPLLNYIVFVLAISYSGPYAWRPGLYWGIVVFLEVLVVIAEWRLLLWALGGSSRKLLLTSVLMNAASFGVGVAIVWLFSSGPLR